MEALQLTSTTPQLEFTPNKRTGDYTIVFRDLDNGIFDQALLRVVPAPPVIPVIMSTGETDASPLTMDEGSSVELVVDSGSIQLPGREKDYFWRVNGTTVENTRSPQWTFTPTDEGEYQITMTAVYETRGGENFTVTTPPYLVVVNNVGPNISLDPVPTSLTSGPLSVSGIFSDPGDDTWLATADFGDGNQRPFVLKSDKSFSIQHQYERPGSYQVAVRIDDLDGGTTTQTFELDFDPFGPTQIAAIESIDESFGDTKSE